MMNIWFISFLLILFSHSAVSANESDVSAQIKSNVNSSLIEKIFLWTRYLKSGQEYELLSLQNDSSVIRSHFVGSNPTYILIHGFLGDGLEPWIIGMKDKLLKQSDVNVISVQWPAGSAYFVIDYYHVVYHVPVVGQEVSDLIGLLKQYKRLSTSDVHIIGHSLGAHIAGFVGKNCLDVISRITGLDPAGLTFRGTDATKRLDKSDAAFVDVIHTNGCKRYISWTDCFGYPTNLGHADFWPNGGRHQPACHEINREKNKALKEHIAHFKKKGINFDWSIGCDHMMSHTYYLESLDYSRESKEFLSRLCDSYSHYQEGACPCNKNAQFMGINVDTRGFGSYFLSTSNDSPFALPDEDCPVFPLYMNTFVFIIFIMSIILIPLSTYSCYVILVLSEFEKERSYEERGREVVTEVERSDEDGVREERSDEDGVREEKSADTRVLLS